MNTYFELIHIFFIFWSNDFIIIYSNHKDYKITDKDHAYDSQSRRREEPGKQSELV